MSSCLALPDSFQNQDTFLHTTATRVDMMDPLAHH